MICFACKSAKIVHVVVDGDMVCRACGVVQQAHVIDDTYWGNAKYNDATEECLPAPLPYSEPQHPLRKSLKEACFHLMNTENTLVTERTIHFVDILHGHGIKRKTAIATCFYLATKEANVGLNASIIYAYFQVPIWKEYNNVVAVLSPELRVGDAMCCESLRRMVYTCYDIDVKLQWKIIKAAESIRQKVHGIVGVNGKPSKLNACYIYIARKLIEPNMFCIEDHCKFFDVSVSTLNKHERMIQAALQESH